MALAVKEAEASFQKDLVYRRWVTEHGGVYAPETERTLPNPYLHNVEERDITTPGGRRLTLINPAYMTRQVHAMAKEQYGVRGHITSMNPLRPENEPDEWEKSALVRFKEGAELVVSVELMDGEPFLRHMRRFVTEPGCLKCHGVQGYKAGDVRGGISTSVPLAEYNTIILRFRTKFFLMLCTVWAFGLLLFNYGARVLKKQIDVEETIKRQMEVQSKLISKSQEIAQLGSWHLDIEKNELTWSEEQYKIFGYARDGGFGETYEAFLKAVHPDDREMVNRTYLNAIENRVPYECKHRIVRPDGEVRFVIEKSEDVRDACGQVISSFGYTQDITNQVVAQEALRNSELKYRTIFEQAADYILVLEPQADGPPTIVDASESAAARHGYTFEEMIGKPISLLDSELSPEVSRERDGILASSGHHVFETVHQCKDGSVFPVEASVTLFDNPTNRKTQFISIERDITDRVQTEDKLKESEKRFRLAFFTSPDAVNINRMDGTYLEINEGFTQLTGYTKEDVIGKTSTEMSIWATPEDRQRLVGGLLKDGYVRNLESRFKIKDGSFKQALMSAAIINLKGEPHILSITRDITEIKRAENKKHELEKQLQQAQKMESLGRLTGGVAHDFNNLLSVIMGYTEMALKDTTLEESVHANLKIVFEAASRSSEIVSQLLAFSRKQTISPEVIDLNERVEGSLNLLRRLIGEDVGLVWQPCNGVTRIEIDPVQVNQLVTNLCVNARDAISGTGQITISTRIVDIGEAECARNPEYTVGTYVQLILADNGSGIPPEHLDKIFEPFFTSKELGKGTGLGLATVYGIVKQNKGLIEVRSSLDNGTVFTISFPSIKETDAEKVHSLKKASARGNGQTILIVEDEKALLEMIITILTALGYQILAAQNPAEALKISDNHLSAIDLLLTDVIMPQMNGKELAQMLKEKHRNLRVLYMSGYTDDIISDKGVLEKNAHFIAKPFNTEALASKLEVVLKD